ncbi:MAG: hypothetical protein Q9M20_03900 [Mariprofundaceae bacterium]|nr:hypothetical protein [Mariprofundaceae bacterium]
MIGRNSCRARKMQKREIRVLLLLCLTVSVLFVGTLAFFQGLSFPDAVNWVSELLSEEEKRTIWNDLSDESKGIIQKHTKP